MCSHLEEAVKASDAVEHGKGSEEKSRLPWPEDSDSTNTRCRSIYSRWTYSYMNRIFRKV